MLNIVTDRIVECNLSLKINPLILSMLTLLHFVVCLNAWTYVWMYTCQSNLTPTWGGEARLTGYHWCAALSLGFFLLIMWSLFFIWKMNIPVSKPVNRVAWLLILTCSWMSSCYDCLGWTLKLLLFYLHTSDPEWFSALQKKESMWKSCNRWSHSYEENLYLCFPKWTVEVSRISVEKGWDTCWQTRD